MRINDIIKRSLVEGYASNTIDSRTIIVCLLITTILATYIYFIYKLVNKNSFYNKNYNLSLIALAIITSAIILTIQSNIVVSLGMVGALSIVRFRTAIKDPMDLVFLFWSISTGIICGAGFAIVAIIASLILSIVIASFSIPKVPTQSFLLVVSAKSHADEKIVMETVAKSCRAHKLCAKNATRNSLNLTIEIKLSKEGDVLEDLLSLDCVINASLVEHNGNATV